MQQVAESTVRSHIRHILRMIRELLAFEPAGRGTAISLALDTVTRLCKRRSIVFLVSDFQAPADDYRELFTRIVDKVPAPFGLGAPL